MKIGENFGTTNGIITMLSLLTGLRATKVNKVGIIGAILAMIIADPLSDAYSMYYAEKTNDNPNAYIIGRDAFISQFGLQLIILLIIILTPNIDMGIYYCYIFGIIFTLLYGYKNNKDIENIIMNMVWIFGLVVLTYVSDVMVYKLYKK